MSTLASTIAISVSNPGDDELAARGLMGEHINHAFIETARQVLAAGGALAYGGDLRQGGFTETLRALLRTYSDTARPAVDRVRQYMARPVWSEMSASVQADISNDFTIVKVDGTEGDTAGQTTRARDFTAMRERMTAETDARVVIGGKPTATEGRWPGVVEEAALSIERRRPLYVCGGLGGAGALVASALREEWPGELTDAYQQAHSEHSRSLAEAMVPPSEKELREALLGADPRNGLRSEDNDLLMGTTDLDMIIALILRGLNALEAVTVPR